MSSGGGSFSTSRGQPFISLRSAAVQIGSQFFFDSLHWTIRSGEQWAVIGRNGSGKTLLAQVLRGIVPLSRGEVDYHFKQGRTAGTSTRGFAPEAAIGHVAFESQQNWLAGAESYYQARWESSFEESSPILSEWLSRQQVLAINPYEVVAPEPNPGAFERLRRRVISLLEIAPLLDRHLTQLSNGEMRKALIARALLQSPQWLILDDPLSGLDAASRAHFRDVLEQLMRRGVRIIYLTSRPEELPEPVTHVLWLESGRAVAQGAKGEILAQWRAAGGSLATDGNSVGSSFGTNHTRHKGARTLVRRKIGPSPELVHEHKPAEMREASCGINSTPRGSPSPRLVSNSKTPVVEMRGGRVVYGESVILHEIEWRIQRGENWALLGPNGSGKTTLLSLITGDNLQAYANDVRLFGKRLGRGLSLWELRRKLALLSPDLQMHHPREVTGWETVCSGWFDTLGLFHRPTSSQRRAVEFNLERFQLSRLANQAFGALSAGEQRLLLLARALVKKPQLLILDEPCQGLDPANRRAVVTAIETLGREGAIQFIFVTHLLEEIPACTTHLLRLRRGRVVEQGPWRAVASLHTTHELLDRFGEGE